MKTHASSCNCLIIQLFLSRSEYWPELFVFQDVLYKFFPYRSGGPRCTPTAFNRQLDESGLMLGYIIAVEWQYGAPPSHTVHI